jgi:hypothetical protein
MQPDWENFAKAVLTDWPTGDLDGSVLFDLSLQYGMIKEVPGGYNSDHHIDADGICPEEGDPWYEYTFRGEAGPGLYSITEMTRRIGKLEAKQQETFQMYVDANEARIDAEAKLSESEALLAKAVEALRFYAESEWPEDYPGGVLYAAGDDAPEFKTHLDYGDKARTTLAEMKGETHE